MPLQILIVANAIYSFNFPQLATVITVCFIITCYLRVSLAVLYQNDTHINIKYFEIFSLYSVCMILPQFPLEQFNCAEFSNKYINQSLLWANVRLECP